MKKKIVLFKANGSWMAEELVNGKPDPFLIIHFGTHIIPTTFTDQASPDTVKLHIKRLNPESEVEVKSENI